MAEEQDSLKNTISDMSDQFKEMHESLDKLTGATKEQTKETKEQTKERKKQTKERKNQSQDAKKKETDRKNTLKAMQAELRKSQLEQNASMADVAAEHLAGGGGLGGAAKAAVGHKVSKLKHKFDPLNIVKKITGGSKIAVALAGKVMGRSEKSIRSFADLAPGMELPTSMFGKSKGSPTPTMGTDKMRTPSQVRGEDGALNKISITLTKILEQLIIMSKFDEKTTEFLKTQVDKDDDDRAKERAARRGATKLEVHATKAEKSTEKEGEGLMSILMKGLFSPLGLAIAGLVTAAIVLYTQWQNLKTSFGLLGQSISELWESIKTGVVAMKDWVKNTLTSISDSIIDMGESVVEGVKRMNPFGYTPPTEAEKIEKLKETAAGGGALAGHAQRKLNALNTEKEESEAPGKSATAIEKLVPTYSAKIPANAKSTAAEALKRGDYDAAATGALLGDPTMPRDPEQKAITGAVTQLTAKAYGDVWKDAQGKPLTPMTDTKENRERRVPPMVKEVTKALGNSLSSGAPAAVPNIVPGNQTLTPAMSAPTELPAPAPQTGNMLSQANDLQRNAAMTPAGRTGGNPTIINNVKNQTTNSSTLHQTMPPARSGESSYLRSLDRGYVPA